MQQQHQQHQQQHDPEAVILPGVQHHNNATANTDYKKMQDGDGDIDNNGDVPINVAMSPYEPPSSNNHGSMNKINITIDTNINSDDDDFIDDVINDYNDYNKINGIRDAFSVASTILTADAIEDPTSFKLNCLIVFLGDMSRGIFFPTMWNLVQQLGGDQVLLGYVIASFSFGRMLVLPLFGTWSTKHGYKWTLQISTAILLVGTLLFGQVLNIGSAAYLIFANAVLGIGSGTLGVTMAYTSEVTPKRNRTGYIAWVTAVQYAGTTATPFIGSLLVVLFSKGDDNDQNDNRGFPEINEFTAPALFMTFMSALSLFLITKYFEDRQRCKTAAPRKLSTRQRNNEEIANTPACFGYLNIRTLCLLGCMVMNAFTKGPMSCFETLGIEFAESRFDMYRAEAGSIVATMGLLGALILIVMGFVFQRFDDTQLTSGGILLFIVGIFMNTQLDQDVDNAHWKYTLSMFFCYSIGYPICHTALVGLFSKIVGRVPQGTLQGWFSASGSIARICFPILAGYIVSSKDIETLFTVLACVLSFSMVFLITFRKVLTLLAS